MKPDPRDEARQGVSRALHAGKGFGGFPVTVLCDLAPCCMD